MFYVQKTNKHYADLTFKRISALVGGKDFTTRSNSAGNSALTLLITLLADAVVSVKWGKNHYRETYQVFISRNVKKEYEIVEEHVNDSITKVALHILSVSWDETLYMQ